MTREDNPGTALWRALSADWMKTGTAIGFLLMGAHEAKNDLAPTASLSQAQVYSIAHQVAADTTKPLEIKLDGLDQRIDDLRQDLHSNGTLSDAKP